MNRHAHKWTPQEVPFGAEGYFTPCLDCGKEIFIYQPPRSREELLLRDSAGPGYDHELDPKGYDDHGDGLRPPAYEEGEIKPDLGRDIT